MKTYRCNVKSENHSNALLLLRNQKIYRYCDEHVESMRRLQLRWISRYTYISVDVITSLHRFHDSFPSSCHEPRCAIVFGLRHSIREFFSYYFFICLSQSWLNSNRSIDFSISFIIEHRSGHGWNKPLFIHTEGITI